MTERQGSFSDSYEAFREGVEDGLRVAAEEIMAAADVLCPKDTLTLVHSRFIDDVERSATGAKVTIGYGRGTDFNPKTGEHPSEYAVPVHEILNARHAPPTQAKYLETAALAYEPTFGATLRITIEARLVSRIRP
jgi:hypothetical protein